MIPQVFIHIPSMPLTPSGKIDRHALQIKPVRIKTETDTLNDSVISDSPIARIWKDILGTNSVSLEDNFFELGGSSISAMRIVSKINKNTDFHANINLIFEYPVFNDFVRALEKEASETEKEHDKTFADQKLTDPEKLFWAANYTSKKPEAYTLTEVFELNGQINTNRLQRSFEFLISQFPKLRTNFRFRFDKIEKVIKNEKSYPFCLRDYSNLDISRARKKARQTQEHIANIPMDLEKDWLFVAYYLKLSEVEGLLIFHAHHIVMDARAMEIISKKFWDYYEHHQDYKLVENINSMHSQPTDDEKTFWKEYLSRADDNLTSLPYDNPKNETTENNGKTIIHPLPLRLAREGSKTATALGITPFSLFRNIFSLLLHRLSNQVNLTVGTAVSLRDDNSENDIGVFLNTLPIRSTLRSGEPIEKYLVRQNKEFIHCFKHRNLSLPHILKLIQNDCKKDSQPLFNVMFDYIAEEGTSKVIGLQVKRQRAFPATALFDLTLTVKELNCGFELLWEYNTNLFNEKTLRKFMNWYENIFHNSINDLKQNASKIDFLTQKEKQLLEDFNSTDITIPNSCFIQEFEKNISKFSDKIAATSGDKTIDYKTLNQKANILARKLLEHKIGINDKIGVLMPRGIDLIISILAIWKVRAVYVPLEPDFPDDRIRQMSMQANLSCIISKNEYSRERVITEVPFLHFDSVQKKKEADMENLNIRGSMNDLVYVIFTSGSTGKPKGVMIEQLGMVNHCNEMIKFFHLKENTIMAQTASHCFDISIWQLVAPLLIGGKIIIYSKDHQLNLKALFESIIEDKITIAELVPSYLFALLEHINHHVNNNRLNDLCHMLTTGEAASNKLVESWYAIYPEIPLTNAYGPAEASDDTNLYTLTKQEAIPNTPIPVGKPIGNVKIYILDSFLNRCPIGIKGEIYISGIAVGKGYINDHEKTKAAFLTNPFSGNKERMYKTGDIGSWNSDGTINFYGRTDFQVKIRGYRIELEEIENQIEDIPYVSQAVIIVKNFGNSKQLYAFITGQGQIEENPIRSSLQAKLPAYMIPQRIIQLNEIPLNHNGKADRKLLSKIDIANHQEKLDKVLSEKQQILLETWKSIFKDNEITINDNFFDLGGDSISSIQIISRLLSQGYELDIENFFAHPTICQLASFVIKKQYIGSIPISEKPFFLTPIQKSFLEKSLGNPNWYNQCVVIEGKKWNTEKLKESLLHTLKAHPAFSLRFNNFEQQYIKSVDFSKYIFEYSADELNDEQILSNMNKMINIKEGPIIVATISDKGNSEFKLFIVAHHLIIDAFSWSIFIDDLEKNYHNALLENNHNQKSLGSNLHEWATYLEKRSFKKIVSSRLPYWEKILKDNKIPISSSIPQKNNGNHRIISLGANANFSKKIADFIANNSSRKLEHLVISILTRALCKWLASDEIAVMLERHGRSHVPNNFNISRTIGWFTVIHPFLVKLNMDGNIAQAHAIAKDLENLKDDGISYGLLKYRGSMNNPLKKIPEPDIAINFLGEMCRANSNGYFSNYKLIPDQTVDPRRQLEYKLEINTYLVEGRLVIECTYDQECFPISLMNQLVEEIEINIKNLSAEIDSSKRDKKIEMPTSSFSNERLSEIQNRLAGTISNG
jgi:amino acid adenylation domain-containing protein/non-ribosomal peptide synthase protein (TIGR01720 family)